MRQAYDTGWLPPSVADRVAGVRVDAAAATVILTLVTGSILVDRLDRIDILGSADDVAVAEIAAAVRRRGWDDVTVEGTGAFRVAAAKALYALVPPVTVADTPLTAFELAEIDDARPPAPTSFPLAPSPRRGRPQGGGERRVPAPGGPRHGLG